MLYISISSLILVFFILFLKALAYMNNSITIVKERGIKVDIYRLYKTSKLKLVIITITPSITFIFKRIYIGLAISIILLDI
jgi:hypothetical protein